MTDDIVWTLPGTSRISGEARGLDAVIQRTQTIVSYGLTFTLLHVLMGQYGLALSLHNTAQRGDKVLDEHLATVCGLRDGKISAIDSYLSDVDMVDAFFV
ncbi:MAG: nuclear transport factor 2 family protein [Ignavibacteriota bacterium]